MRGGLRNIAMQLRKVCVHPYLFLDNPNSSYSCGVDHSPEDPEEIVRASGKVALLDSVLEKLKATGHRVLLFSQWTMVLDLLERLLTDAGLSWSRLDGSTPSAERLALVAHWHSFNLDEYVGLGPGDPGSFAAAMDRQLAAPLGLSCARLQLPDGRAPQLCGHPSGQGTRMGPLTSTPRDCGVRVAAEERVGGYAAEGAEVDKLPQL